MQLGMIGPGRMGANIVRRLQRDGHECVVFDLDPAAVTELAGEGATGAAGVDDFVQKPTRPRAVWPMVPAAVTGRMVAELAGRLEPGDVIVDGGNSYYRDDIDRAGQLRLGGSRYVDCGTSGGVWGLERGYCLMIGGDGDAVTTSTPSSAASRPAWTRPRVPRDARASPPRPSAATCTAAPTARAAS